MKKYDTYKDSGIEWIGEIPGHWKVRRLKNVSTINDDSLSDKTPDDFEIEYVDISSIESGVGITNTESFKFSDAPSRARRLVKHGDIIVSTVRTYLKAISKIEYPKPNLVVSTGFAVIRPKTIQSGFAGHLFYNENLLGEIVSRSVGVSYPAINSSDIATINIPLPPESEQIAIASYLDQKTTAIDQLISDKKRLLELYEEEKAAIINHAVTKGINPNAPMKDSGIDWLAEIPEHWEVKRLKYVGESIIGIIYSPKDITQDKENSKLVLRASNIQEGKLSLTDNVYVNLEVKDKQLLNVGDILICSRSGSSNLIGKNIMIDKSMAGQTFGAFMTVFRSKLFDFVYYYFNSQIFKSQTALFKTSTINQLTINTLNNFYIPLPPIDEQQSIVNFIASETAKIDSKITYTEKLIALLEEYRTALISEVVTGKIKIF